MGGRNADYWLMQAIIGGGQSIVTTNFPQVGLFNNSQAHLLVVRDWRVSIGGTSSSAQFALTQTRITGTAGVVSAVYPPNTALPGQIDQINSAATAGTGFYFCTFGTQDAYWNNQFPFVVILPGWQLVCQGFNGSSTMRASFAWEARHADELRSWPEAFEESA